MAWEWGQGPTVLLVHGWSGYSGQMQHFVTPLLQAGFHVVAIDLPAHGQSSGKRLTLPVLAETLATVLFRLRPHAVIAHSFGASAMALAVREGYQPKQLLLIAPAVEMETFVRRAVAAAGLSAARADGMLRLIERLVGPISQFDLRTFTSTLSVPTVLVHDEGDDEVPIELLREASRVWTKGTLVATEGYGHSGHLRSPQFCEATAAFLKGDTPALTFPLQARDAQVVHLPRGTRDRVQALAQAVISSHTR
jgi:pimeloyl-ACP methyl ester carboxylesterase